MAIPLNVSCAELTYKWRCKACGETVTEMRHMPSGGEFWIPSFPEGWHEIVILGFHEFYCPKHQVLTLIDGRPVE